MNLLSRTEEIILLTILKLKDNAYGFSIREQIFKDTGKRWSFASIYQPLGKLTRKEYVKKVEADASRQRQGKKKYLYRLTPEGKGALKSIYETQKNLWADVPLVALD
jgi:DNA-binding PadR family transcriptional regulator